MTFTPEETDAILISLQVAFWATVGVLPVGLGCAWLLARTSFPGKALFEAAVYLPLVMPPVVTGYLLLLAFGRQGAIGGLLEDWFGIVLAFRWTGAALACAVMSLPLVIGAIRVALEASDRRLEEAASTLGAPPPMVFLTVTLPLIAPGLIAGTILGFARALGEFGATITFASAIPGETQTVPSLIYALTQVPGGEPAAMKLTLVSVAISLGAILLANLAARPVARMVRGE